ncbi:ABC transporter permease [Kozakia baliensis]|uniref:ABC transporter permease n=1 Tax=Kozakia baliensis TaxID=153496 RepID=UPI0009F2DCEC|nr:ABC transporter permease [Kozakia baliensis]GEL64531.1 ABC transporter permease [Kozakia baliensis]
MTVGTSPLPTPRPQGRLLVPWLAQWLRRHEPSFLIGCGCILLILFIGGIYNSHFLTLPYLLQQLQVASYLGIVAAGAMTVILLGHIDLSVPWTMTTSAMLATGLAGNFAHGILALPIALAIGAAIGLANGLGVAYVRIPSMIFTLGMNAVLQGLMVLYTGGSAPSSSATPLGIWLSNVHIIPGIANAVFCWVAVSAGMIILLRFTVLGRTIYAIGNRERAAYLCGLPVRGAILGAFMLAGIASAFAGLLLTGYAGKAYQGMGDSYLMPAIAAVVLGGTSIAGGHGTYKGTVMGTILIVVLQSVLAVMQMPDAGRQIIYGVIIFSMLMLYGRSPQNAR